MCEPRAEGAWAAERSQHRGDDDQRRKDDETRDEELSNHGLIVDSVPRIVFPCVVVTRITDWVGWTIPSGRAWR
jgi:hypothetical protein